MTLTRNADESESHLAALTLSDLICFNGHIIKLVHAGVPIRFPGAPISVTQWLEGINQRVTSRVELGESVALAITHDPYSNAAYRQSLSAWLNSRRDSASDARLVDAHGAACDLRVLEPWVQAGLSGDREVDRSAVFAFWLWIIALMASVSLVFSVGRIFPKLQQFYEDSGYERGIGYLGCQWIYDRLGAVAVLLAGLLVAAPVLWRFWFQRIAKYRTLSSQLRMLFFAAYLVVGGAMVLAVGSIVLWPITELLMQVGEPRP
jgi:hypothetical protein